MNASYNNAVNVSNAIASIAVRVPLRVSFIGGGTDIKSFYEVSDGLLVSTTIDRYIYISVSIGKAIDAVHLNADVTENVSTSELITNPLVRETLKYLDISSNILIQIRSDVTSYGSGLGASSAVIVGLLHAIGSIQGRSISPSYLSCSASEIEIERCNRNIGLQDQYAAAFGGLREYRILKNGDVENRLLSVSSSVKSKIQGMLVLCDTGITRNASESIKEQEITAKASGEWFSTLSDLANLAAYLIDDFEKGEVDNFGSMMHEAWSKKRQLSKGTGQTTIVDEIYKKGLISGAIGGKVLGAGNGGYMLFVVPTENRYEFDKKMKQLNPRSITMVSGGTQIVY